jgi:hypothetical protein
MSEHWTQFQPEINAGIKNKQLPVGYNISSEKLHYMFLRELTSCL